MSLAFLCLLTAIVNGKVFDVFSNMPLEAHIYVKSIDQIIPCAMNGGFILHSVPAGCCSLIVSHVGFKEETLAVELSDNDITYLNIGMTQSPIPIEPVIVRREKIASSGSRSLQQNETMTVPGAERDIFKVIQTLPGVATPTDYLGVIYVRGGELYENRVFFDNIEITSPYHYFGVGSVFNTDMIESFEFLSGALPSRYGNVISSVLDIKSKKPAMITTINASFDPIEANWFYSCPLNNMFSFIFSSKRNYLDLLLKNIGIGQDMVLPYYTDHQGKFIFDSKVGLFSIAALKSDDRTSIEASLLDEDINLKIDNGSRTLAFNWVKSWATSDELNIIFYHSDSKRELYGTMPPYGQATERIEDEKQGFRGNLVVNTDKIVFETGGGYEKYHFAHSGQKIEDIFYGINLFDYWLEFDTTDNYAHLYSSQLWKVLNPINCQLGERIDWFPAIMNPVFSPRIKIIYDGRPTLFLSYGQHHQLPPLEYGVNNPKTMYAKCLSLGFNHYVKQSISLNIEIYHKKYYNLVQLCDKNNSSSRFENDGDGYAYGIETSVRKFRISDNFGWISYAYSLSKRATPYSTSLSEFFAQRPHIFNLVIGKEFTKRFEMGLKYVIASGPAQYEIIGRDWDGLKWIPVYAPGKSQLPVYQRLDLHVQRYFNLLGFSGEFYLTILNVTNHRNVQGYFYNSDYTMRKAFYMMPLIPLIGLRLSF